MEKKKRFIFLSEKFYAEYPKDKYPELEQKHNRPYIQICVEIRGILFAIPLRSDIRHPHVLWTDKKNHCGLDFSKAVVISEAEYIDALREPYLRKKEFDALRGKDYKIKKRMEQYVTKYINARAKQDLPINKTLVKYSSLQYFEEFFIEAIKEQKEIKNPMNHFIELHLHLDGSLRPETVWELAKEQGITLPAKTLEEAQAKMRVPEDCKTLEEYLERFDLPLLVLQKADALERVAFELVEDLAKEGVDYAEIRFAPQLSVAGGLTQDQVTEAAVRGVKRGMERYPQIRAGLILCCMRGDKNLNFNLETVETAKKHLGDVVCAVDIAGAESLYPTELFKPVFDKVREYRIPMTIHAGEAAGPDSMWTALSYGTKRIGHGVAAVKDPKLVEKLIEDGVTLEVCVTSNYHTKVVNSITEHPIRRLFDAGVRVTVNSDNMTASNTDLCKEIRILKDVLGFTDGEIEKMEEYAYEARFLK